MKCPDVTYPNMISLGNGYGDSFIFRTNSVATIENTTDKLSQLSGTAFGSKIFKINLTFYN